jgi:hypothetical protein
MSRQQSRDDGKASAATVWGAATNNNILISVKSLLCGIEFCDTPSFGHKTDGQTLSLGSYPSSSEYDITKNH